MEGSSDVTASLFPLKRYDTYYIVCESQEFYSFPPMDEYRFREGEIYILEKLREKE